MSKIRFLDELVINQIAAGEVIENSASVVKELVENSLDSGAQCITVEILGGGRQLIRVSDDGCGMSLEEARLCLQRHATSKLVALEDLESINTKGFRGEAIPSIASISQMTLLTSNEDESSLLLIEGGKLLSESLAVRDRGTTMEIKSLFFNVPVRKKYQRSPSYDVRSVDKMLRQIALGHPYQGFQFISDGKTLFHVHPQELSVEAGSAIRNRMENLMGREIDNSEWVDFEGDEIKIRGFIGKPQTAKRSRSGQTVWVNRRSIFSPLVAQSVKNGMGSMLQEGFYPVFSLFIDLPGTLVDVNVHPQKKEVRFCDEEKMRSLIAKAIYGTFHGKGSVFNFSSVDYSASYNTQPNENFSSFAFFNPGPSFIAPKEEQIEWIPSHFQVRPQIITLIKGYVVLEAQTLPKNWYAQEREGLAFLDQRLAHERILLESIGENGKESKVSQALLIPKTIELGALQCSLLKEHENLLKKMGIDLKIFGEGAVVIEALPESMAEEQLLALLTQLGDELQEYSSSHQEKSALKLISRMAMRRDRRLSLVEANHLLDALMQCQSPSLCPRGRPIIKMVGLKELEKW